MKNKINIAELLKDCPKGMELDYALFEDTIFIGVEEDKNYPILIKLKNGSQKRLTKYGGHSNADYAKCVIFPKGKTTWEGFRRLFKDGDILTSGLGSIFILKEPDKHNYHYGCYIAFDFTSKIVKNCTQFCSKQDCRFATEEEKAKLFKAIKDNGYKWNAETKTLEKLSEFNDGDILATNNGMFIGIVKIENNIQQYAYVAINSVNNLNKDIPYFFERFATEEEKQRLFNVIKENGYKWNPETRTLEKLPKFKVGDRIKYIYFDRKVAKVVKIHDKRYELDNGKFLEFQDENAYEISYDKFDISTLIPFESRVLVRDTNHYEWEGAVFGRYDGNTFFTIGGNDWRYCIPYEGNEHLFGTTDECDDFYKIK